MPARLGHLLERRPLVALLTDQLARGFEQRGARPVPLVAFRPPLGATLPLSLAIRYKIVIYLIISITENDDAANSIDRTSIQRLMSFVEAGNWPAPRRWSGATARSCIGDAVGRRDLDAGLPVERDTIFRIASMTKPVTTVAALMLLRRGPRSSSTTRSRAARRSSRACASCAIPDGPLDETDDAAARDHVRRSADAPLGPDLRRLPPRPDRRAMSADALGAADRQSAHARTSGSRGSRPCR